MVMKHGFGFSEGAPDNGLHPTADMLLVSYFQTLGAAGDTGR